MWKQNGNIAVLCWAVEFGAGTFGSSQRFVCVFVCLFGILKAREEEKKKLVDLK